MILFPAIDVKNGQCVRLEKGDMARATIFHQNPVEQARIFETQKFEWLHIVNLDGAIGLDAGLDNDNQKIIEAILKTSKLKIQIGGGIRDMSHIRFWLEKGARRVILGTLALTHPEIAKQACRDFPGQIVIALDGQEGWLAVQGWQEISREPVIETAKRISDWGAAAILYTDIVRDGMMVGLNIEATRTLSLACETPVIASGGLRGIEDIKKLIAQKSSRIEGVIAGRALYDGKLNAQEALQFLAASC